MPVSVSNRPVRVRIAPSPTGEPHVGTAYIGLFNLAFAKRHGGQFVLRIEDTDQRRSTPESETAILRSLRWCGLEWDEGPDIGGAYGPYRQSERSALYTEHAERLITAGRAYRCFCTSERLDALRADQRARKAHPRYDGHCRGLDAEQARVRVAAGESCVVRLAFPATGETLVPDALRGQVRYDNAQIDDQVLIKSDGLPTYHLANVVDDHLMEITHVIRAEEWISSTPKHMELYDAFGWEPPVFVHMPLLRNADKSKISKRKNPTSLEYFERAGVLPEAFLNFLGMLGYSMPDESEIFTFEAFASNLDLRRISLGGPVFDLDKLDWLNGQYMRAMAPGDLATRALAQYTLGERHHAVGALVQERMTSLADYASHADIFHSGEIELGLNARYLLVGCSSRKKKAVKLTVKASRAFFEDVISRLEGLVSWQPEAIEEALRVAVQEAGVLVGDGFMSVRVAVAGRPASPPLFESIAALGRGVTLVRLRRATRLLRDKNLLQDDLRKAEADVLATRQALERAADAATSEG